MDDDDVRDALRRHWAASDANDFATNAKSTEMMRCSNTRSPASGSVVGRTFKRHAKRSRTRSGSRSDACSVAAISGSANSSLPTTRNRFTR